MTPPGPVRRFRHRRLPTEGETPSNYSFYNSDITAFGYLGHAVSAGEERLCARLRAEPGPLLDIGCGSGRLRARLIGVRGGVVGLDYAPEQLHPHRQRFPEAVLVNGSALALPFADGSFRTALMSYHLIESILPSRARVLALREAARVLDGTGALALTRHVRHNYHFREQVTGFASRRSRAFGDLTGPARPMRARVPSGSFTMHVLSSAEMRRAAAAARLILAEAWDFDSGGRVHRRSRAVVEWYVRHRDGGQ